MVQNLAEMTQSPLCQSALFLFFPRDFSPLRILWGILYFMRLGEAYEMKQTARVHISVCHLAVCIWTSYSNSPSVSFFICEIKVMINIFA